MLGTRSSSTWVSSSLASKYQTRMEVTDSDKHCSLLQYAIHYGLKKF